MLPVALNLARLPVALVGRGERVARRFALLREANPSDLVVYSDDPEFAAAAAERRLPGAVDLVGRRVVYVVGLDEVESRQIADCARAAGALVNVEDVPALCDFHNPSVLRRGDLSIAVSTAGNNPSLSKLLVKWLKTKIGPEWEGRSVDLSRYRQYLYQSDLSGTEIHAAISMQTASARWLDDENAAHRFTSA
ncbi:MAG: precorrin-2 dehydrogenase/sirohydrochlorin ferrochelatase family protein [Alphaproteobacteria bacterium]